MAASKLTIVRRTAAPLDHGAYTTTQVCDRLSMKRRTFYDLKSRGELTFLEEIKPRLGRLVRYRADLVEEFLANQTHRARA